MSESHLSVYSLGSTKGKIYIYIYVKMCICKNVYVKNIYVHLTTLSDKTVAVIMCQLTCPIQADR